MVIDETAAAFEPGGNGVFKIERQLTEGRALSVRHDGKTMASWQLKVVPDRTPTVAFTQPPSAGQRRALRLEYQAVDDHGIAAVRATITRENAPEGEEPLVLELGVGARGGRLVENSSYHDLTDHLWAGLPVTIQLEAEDAAGQVGKGDLVP